MKKKLVAFTLFTFLILAAFSPLVTFASDCEGGTGFVGAGPGCNDPSLAGCAGFTGLSNILCNIQELLSFVVPVIVALGVAYFVWGVVTYVIASDEEAKKSGKNRIIYGIIGFAVIIGLWGLVNILGSTFGIGKNSTNNAAPTADQLKGLLPK